MNTLNQKAKSIIATGLVAEYKTACDLDVRNAALGIESDLAGNVAKMAVNLYEAKQVMK